MIPREQVNAVMAFYERTWRARTPAKSVEDIVAVNRVTIADVERFYGETFGVFSRFDFWENIFPDVARLHRKLKKEFPDECW